MKLKLRVPYRMLSNPTPSFEVTAENAALLLIDPQHFITSRDRGLGRLAESRGIARELDEYYGQVDAAMRNMSRLVTAARAWEVRVIYTVLNARQPDRTDLSRQLRLSGLPVPVDLPSAEIRPEVTPGPEDLILPRGTYSPFAGTELMAWLRRDGIDTLVMAGMMANISVALAAREATDRDLGVIWIWDASASETLDWHKHTQTGIVGPLIRIRTTQQVIEMMEGTRT